MLGYGPDGHASRGYRQRLTARAMALRDGRGEILVLAVADLDFIPGILHREVAARVRQCAGLDADRLLLSATHTHSGPGNMTGHKTYDAFGTPVGGFDPELLRYLADRISGAMLEALGRMAPARAGWGQTAVWRLTRMRSLAAHQADLYGWPSPFRPPPGLDQPALAEIDPTLTVFRVDTLAGPGAYRPAGAWALFAMHGTGIPPANDVYDADVHGVAAAVFERRIDELARGSPAPAEPSSIAMFANGAEGDVLPNTRFPERVCATLVVRREQRPGNWRTPPGGDVALPRGGADARECLDIGIRDTWEVGERLGQAAAALFAAMTDSLSNDVRLSRGFAQVPLRGPGAPAGLCSGPRPGMAQLAGAETRQTRYLGFRWLGLFPSGIEPGGHAVAWSGDCHSPKRTPLKTLQSFLAGQHGFEEAAQFLVARIGEVLVGAVPFEPTTTAGARMRAALATAASSPSGPRRTILVGLANNYVSYVATRLEYQRQYYEGGSTLYGPASADVYAGELARLARQLAHAGWASPPTPVPPFPVFPGPGAVIVRFAPQAGAFAPRLEGARSAGDRLVFWWEDAPAGGLIPFRRRLFDIERRDPAGAWTAVARDGAIWVEVREVGATKEGRARWEGRFMDPGPGTYRVRFLAPPGGQDVVECLVPRRDFARPDPDCRQAARSP